MADKNLVPKESRIFMRKLKEARKQAGMTQEDLVTRTGLTQVFISNVETGKSTLSLDNASRLAEAVGQPLWKLLNPSD